MLPLTALLLPLRRICGSCCAIAIGPSAAVATATPSTTTLAITAAAASATSAAAMPAMPASVAISAVSAVPAIASVSPLSARAASAVGYGAWIITAGAVCLRLAAVVALVSRLGLVVALDALDALVGRSRSGAASISWPAVAVWVVVLIVHNGAEAPRDAEHEKGG